MLFKYVSITLLFVISFETVGCLNLGVSGGKSSNKDLVSGSGLDILNKGKTYVKIAEQRIRKGNAKTQYDHPKYLKSDYVSGVLASVFFKERGVKGWSNEKNVFQESELLELLPHIINALSKASPSQHVLVRSYYAIGKSRFLKTEMYTIFALFVSNGKLNLRFSRIQYVPVLETDDTGIFTGNQGSVFTDPFSVKKNPSWKLVPRPGQRLTEGYDNWLVIDLEEGAFVKEEQENKSTVKGQAAGMHIPPIQAGSQIYNSNTGGSQTYPVPRETKRSIKDQLLELKELEKTGLITSEDYERRKALILGERQEKSIKDKFVDLRNLRDEGYIGDTDYERQKRKLLDEYEVSGKEIKDVLAEYLELRDEGFITDADYDYVKKKLLKEF